jgi:hypothetical protein
LRFVIILILAFLSACSEPEPLEDWEIKQIEEKNAARKDRSRWRSCLGRISQDEFQGLMACESSDKSFHFNRLPTTTDKDGNTVLRGFCMGIEAGMEYACTFSENGLLSYSIEL